MRLLRAVLQLGFLRRLALDRRRRGALEKKAPALKRE